MEQLRAIRIVVASPGDVKKERSVMPRLVAELNAGIAAKRGLIVVLLGWDTDAHPGFHQDGPQGLIDSKLRIEDCDLLIGIFWTRFGTPVKDAGSGTEHEFKVAYEAWKQRGRPQIYFYFNMNPSSPRTEGDLDQWKRVVSFREGYPKEGLWWSYKGKADFERLVRKHLTDFILEQPEPPQPPVSESPDEEVKETAPEDGRQPQPNDNKPKAGKLWKRIKQIISRLWMYLSKPVYAISTVTIAVIASLSFYWLKPLECGDINAACIKLDLATGPGQLTCFVNGEAEIKQADIQGLQSLSGQAELPTPGKLNECPCEWGVGTDKTLFVKSPSSKNCLLDISLPPGVDVKIVFLNLYVGKQSRVFKINIKKD